MQAFFSFLRSTSILDDGYCSPMTDAVPPIVETDEDVRQEIIDTVRRFVAKDVLPVASDLEHADEFPAAIVETMSELGLFGVTTIGRESCRERGWQYVELMVVA